MLESWAQTLASPQFPNRSEIRATSRSMVSTTLSEIKKIFSRSDVSDMVFLLARLRCSEVGCRPYNWSHRDHAHAAHGASPGTLVHFQARDRYSFVTIPHSRV